MPSPGAAARKQIAAAIIGNALDWYDFALFGFMASSISTQFFPSSSIWRSLYSTYAVFAISFFVRPVGGFLIGYIADRFGRKAAMLLVIALMAAGTAIVAFSPNYAAIGILAPVIVLFGRLLQGMGAGGEFAAATSFLIEHAPRGARGFFGGWQLAGQGFAIALAAVIAGTTSAALSPDQFARWGWRVPFIFGLLVAPVGAYFRKLATDTPVFLQMEIAGHRSPIVRRILHFKMRLAIGLGLVIGGTAALYALFIFMPTYALHVLKLDPRSSLVGPIAAGLGLTVLCPMSGALSDRIGRKPVIVFGTCCSLLVLYPAFLWLQVEASFGKLMVVELILGLCIGIYGGPFSTTMAELFPADVRATAISVTYNIGVAMFGGLAPLTVSWLLSVTGNSLAPAYYVMSCMVVSVIAAISLPAAASAEA